MQRSFAHLGTISVFFVAVLLISNIASTKILQLGPLTLDGGTLLFPLSYIFADILTEVYGFARARRVIWLGFFCAAMMSATLYIVGMLPAAADWGNQGAYDLILGQAPRIVAASLLAYLCGEFINSYILAKMKVWTAGKWLAARTIGSTLVGQGVDSTIFILVAFSGLLPSEVLIALIISNYVLKTAIEILFTPATYAIVRYLKRTEHEDHFDRDTNFNPLSLR